MAAVPLPPDSRSLYRHGMTPDISHDEAARINVLASLNANVAATLSRGVKLAYEHEVAPKRVRLLIMIYLLCARDYMASRVSAVRSSLSRAIWP